MKNKLLIGILVFLGIVVTVFNPVISGLCAVGIWIYLVRMVRKQKNAVLDDQMEQEITKRLLKKLKAFLIVAGFSFLVFAFGSIVHNVLHGLSKREETVSFFVALVALLVFIAGTAGGKVVFLKARKYTSIH